MTESRGAMTAQQFWPKWIKDEGIWGGDAPVIGKESGYRFADALSAHNTAQLTQELADVREVLAKGIDRAPGDESVYQLAVIATNGIYWRDQELSRLRSQGAGQWVPDEELYALAESFFAQDGWDGAEPHVVAVAFAKEVIGRSAPVEGAGQWEAALRKYGVHSVKCPRRYGVICGDPDCPCSSRKPCNCGLDEALAGLASPPESQP